MNFDISYFKFDQFFDLDTSDEGSLYYLRDILNTQNRTDELVRVLREVGTMLDWVTSKLFPCLLPQISPLVSFVKQKTCTIVRAPPSNSLSQGRRLGFLDVKFTDEPELFTDNQDTVFGIPIWKIKVNYTSRGIILVSVAIYC